MTKPFCAQLVMLSGAGTNWKLMAPQQAALGEAMICPDWIDPLGPSEPLPSYVQRWTEQIAPRLDPDRPLLLGGMSMGGVLALEMAKILRPRALLLVASCRSRAAVPRHTRLAAAIESRLPEAVERALVPVAPWLFKLCEPLDRHQRRLVAQSIREGNIAARQWSERMLLRWDADGQLDATQQPLYMIHGKKDPIFPINRVDADEVIPEGRHLISLTHGDIVSRFLLDRMRRHTS